VGIRTRGRTAATTRSAADPFEVVSSLSRLWLFLPARRAAKVKTDSDDPEQGTRPMSDHYDHVAFIYDGKKWEVRLSGKLAIALAGIIGAIVLLLLLIKLL
jgi:hypothetical protein